MNVWVWVWRWWSVSHWKRVNTCNGYSVETPGSFLTDVYKCWVMVRPAFGLPQNCLQNERKTMWALMMQKSRHSQSTWVIWVVVCFILVLERLYFNHHVNCVVFVFMTVCHAKFFERPPYCWEAQLHMSRRNIINCCHVAAIYLMPL